jgi:hypothetical protein
MPHPHEAHSKNRISHLMNTFNAIAKNLTSHFGLRDFVNKKLFVSNCGDSSRRRFQPNLATSFFYKKKVWNQYLYILKNEKNIFFYYFWLHILEPSMEIWLFYKAFDFRTLKL